MLFTVHQNRSLGQGFCIVRESAFSGALGRLFYIIESRVQGAKGILGDWRCTQEVEAACC